MSIFNSLGSNYTFSFAFRALFAGGAEKKKYQLVGYLEKRYGGTAYLTYKGREALELALQAVQDTSAIVAINGFTCYAVYKATKNSGHEIHYLDVESGAMDFSPASLLKAVEKNPALKIVVVQNTLGYPCDIQALQKICRDKDLILIEDLAHSIGAAYTSGEEAGTVGDFVILSFSQDKVVDGISGGALIIRNKDFKLKGLQDSKQISRGRQLKDRCYPFLTCLIRATYPIGVGKLLHKVCRVLNLLPKPVAGNLDAGLQELPNWQAGLIRAQYRSLDWNLAHKKEIADIYASRLDTKVLLKKVNGAGGLRFPIVVNKRESLIKHLHAQGIYVSDIWYDAPIAPQKYLHLTDYKGQCPHAEELAGTILNLPTHINVSKAQAEQITVVVNEWVQHNY